MSKIGDLVEQYCPNGVEYYTLGEVCSFKKGQSITSKDIVKGNIPVIAGGKSPAYYHNKANRFGETVAVSSSGAYAGFVSYWSIPVFLSDSFSVEPKDILLTKYLYYFLNNLQDYIYSLKSIGGIPHIYARNIDKFKIPVPPMPIQQEIVRILDKYSEFENKLEIKLQEEIDTRKKQYEFYRNKLLSFSEDVTFIPLSQLCVRQKGIPITAAEMKLLSKTNGSIRIFAGGNTYVDVNHEDIPQKNIIMRKSIIVKSRGNIGFEYYDKPFSHKNEMWSYSAISNMIELKYVYYYLVNNVTYFQSKAKVGKLPQISTPLTDNYMIPIPYASDIEKSLKEQKRIVKLLDDYTFLEKELEIKLQEEIDVRKKQYEYYRNNLLTFSPKLKEGD